MPSSFGDQSAGEPSLDSQRLTYDQALDLGHVGASSAISRHGSLGEGEAGDGEVEWYRFTLDRTARVSLRLEGSQPDPSFRGVLSLFNNAFDPEDFTNPQGLRRLELAVAAEGDGVATLDRVIGPGTYNLAVSGAGNEIFSPLVAHTGLPGSSGEFDLSLSVFDAGIGPSDGPWVLNSDPAPETVLLSSPLVIRVELSRSLAPATIESGRTVQLNFSPNGTFSAGQTQAIPLAALHISNSVGELVLVPASPLAPGYYQVVLAGNGELSPFVLTGIDGVPLGSDAEHPAGRDHLLRFQVRGVEGRTNLTGPADDTAAGAHELGDLMLSEPVQVKAAIGDDPYYNPGNAPDPAGPLERFRPGNDLDLYHFRVSGPGPYTFFADVFAGRIGSPLAPGLRLFRFNAETEELDPLDLTTFLYNITPFDARSVLPQLMDATMSGILEPGDYYLSVSAGFPWWYDPGVSRSHHEALDPGPYTLNLLLSPSFADASPYRRIPLIPPFEPDPTDSNGDDHGSPDPWMDPANPPGHGAPPLPGSPGMGGGVSIHPPTPPGSGALPVGMGRPPGGGTSSSRPRPAGEDPSSGEASSSPPLPVGIDTHGGVNLPFTPPFHERGTAGGSPPSAESSAFTPLFQDKQAAGISSSTDLSVLAFQPVGGVTRSEQEPATEAESSDSKPAAVTSVSSFSSRGMVASAPALIGLAPALSPAIAAGNTSSQLEPGFARITPAAVRSGVGPQQLVPWGPDPSPFDSRRAVVANGFAERTLEFLVPKRIRQPLALAATATVERAVVPDEIATEPPPVAEPASDDGLNTDPVAPGPLAAFPSSRSPSEGQAERPPTWKLGWTLLAITGVSGLTFFRYRGAFKTRWSNLLPLCREAGK